MSATAVLGLLFTSVSIVACSVGFVAPFWLENSNWNEQWGLWGICEGSDDCIWFFQDDFAWENTLPTWHKICQVLYTLGMIVLIISFFVGCIHLCCAWQKTVRMNLAISALLMFSFACFLISVATFGGTVHEKLGADLFGSYIYKWGFFTAVGGLCGTAIAALFYLAAGCKKNPYQGYVKSQPVGPNYTSGAYSGY